MLLSSILLVSSEGLELYEVQNASWPLFIVKAWRGEYMSKDSLNLHCMAVRFVTPCAVIEENLDSENLMSGKG